MSEKSNTQSRYIEYRDRVLNTKSPSFCGAKWYNATIFLGNGKTSSCHLPPVHQIPLDELKNNPSAIHNTSFKKSVRKEMLEGKFPKECDYCWKIEGIDKNQVSDRVFKSIIFSDEDLQKAFTEHKHTENVNLRTLEISFDRICNFACSYCHAAFSTTWAKDIKTNGPYKKLYSDGASSYFINGDASQPYGLQNKDNPYVEAFWKWLDSDLKNSLHELRITGGEATLSPNFWKLLEWFKTQPNSNIRLSVNSNLSCNDEVMDRLLSNVKQIKRFSLYTSNESFGASAEYIRDGLKWDHWLKNVDRVLSEFKIEDFGMMMTINALCLFSLTDFMDVILSLKEKYNSNKPFMSFNILRFPSFLSVLTLPKEILHAQAQNLSVWLLKNNNHPYFTDWEKESLKRLIHYLVSVDKSSELASPHDLRAHDLKSFLSQYDQRRNKNFRNIFPAEFINWLDQMPPVDMSKHFSKKDRFLNYIGIKEL